MASTNPGLLVFLVAAHARSNAEMRELRAPPFKMPLKRDIWFEPKVLSEIMEASG